MKTVTPDEIKKNSEDKKVQTVCRDCVFAVYEQLKDKLVGVGEDKPFQTGCSLGRLEKLEANGATLLNVIHEKKDFFVVENRICNTCRGPEWKQEAEQRGRTDLAALAREEISLKCTALIYIGPGQNINQAITTAYSLCKQDLRPSCIIF